MFKWTKKILIKALASLVIVCSSGLFVVSISAQTMNLRDFDATIGLLKRPLQSASQYSSLFKPIQAEAIEAQETTQQAFKAQQQINFEIEKTLNELLRRLVGQIIQGFLNAVTEFFLSILNQIEQLAETIFGIRLNLCNAKRLVSTQSYIWAKTAEKSINTWFGSALPVVNQAGGIEAAGATATALANAGNAYLLAESMKVSDKRHPECATNNAAVTANNNDIKDEIIDSIGQIYQASSQYKKKILEGAQEGVIQDNGEPSEGDGISSVIYNRIYIIDTTLAANMKEIGQNLDEAAELVIEYAESANDQIESETPENCSFAIISNEDKPAFTPGSLDNLENFQINIGDYDFDNATIGVLDVEVNLDQFKTMPTPEPITANDCEGANVWSAVYSGVESASSVTSGTETEGSILDAILDALQGFLNDLSNIITEFITNIIDKIIDRVTGFFEDIANIDITSIFDGFSVIDTLQDALDTTIGEIEDKTRDLENIIIGYRSEDDFETNKARDNGHFA